jgi:hypothetical protein
MKNNQSLFPDLRKKVLQRDNFTCQKCDFKDKTSEGLEVHYIRLKNFRGQEDIDNLITLCSICNKHAPETENSFRKYLNEKVDGTLLETFRKSNNSISKKTKQGMINIFNKGKHITKAPRGYKIINKQLIPSESSKEIKEIFTDFLNNEISLTQLGKKYNMTTAGIKKLLQNTTYIGKVKFANQENKGNHPEIVDKILFGRVQEKLKNIQKIKDKVI